jgi:hypothetical protein
MVERAELDADARALADEARSVPRFRPLSLAPCLRADLALGFFAAIPNLLGR